MADLLLEQEPITATAWTPTIVGTNDGTLWNTSTPFMFVALQQGEGVPPGSDPSRQDEAQAQLSPGQSFTASALWVYVNGLYDSDFVPPQQLVMEWELEGSGWKVAYEWLIPTPESTRYDMTWTFGVTDVNATITGTLTLAGFAADVAAGNVYVRARTGSVPGYGRTLAYDFQVWITESVDDTVVRQHPRDDGLGMSSAPRLYPPPKAQRIVGGYQ